MKLIYECLLWLLRRQEHIPSFGCRTNGPYCYCGLEKLIEKVQKDLEETEK